MNAFQQNPRIACRAIEGESVLIDPHSGTVFVLNGLGSRIWAFLEQPREVGEIVAHVCRQRAYVESIVSQDVTSFVASLDRRGLVEAAP